MDNDNKVISSIKGLLENSNYVSAIRSLSLISDLERRKETQEMVEKAISNKAIDNRNKLAVDAEIYAQLKQKYEKDNIVDSELALSLSTDIYKYKARKLFAKEPSIVEKLIDSINLWELKNLAFEEIFFEDYFDRAYNNLIPESSVLYAYSVEEEDKLKLISENPDEKFQAEIATNILTTDKARLAAMDIITSNYFRVQIALVMVSDEAKLVAMEKVDNDYYKEQIANSLSSYEAMVKAMSLLKLDVQNEEEYMIDFDLFQRIKKSNSENERLDFALKLVKDESKLMAMDYLNKDSQAVLATSLVTQAARLRAIVKINDVYFNYVIVHSAPTDKEKLELMDESGSYYYAELQEDEYQLRLIDRAHYFESGKLKAAFNLTKDEARLKAIRKLKLSNAIDMIPLMTTVEGKISGIIEILKVIASINDNKIGDDNLYFDQEQYYIGYSLIKSLVTQEDIKKVQERIPEFKVTKLFFLEKPSVMTKIKSEIAVALSDDTDMDSLTDNEKIAEIKNIFTGSIKESIDYVKGFKMAKTLQFEKSKKSLINWARKSVGWGLDDLIFETASTLTEESSIVSVLKKYLEDFSFVKPTNYVVTSSLLKSDTARMRVIPWLDELFLRVGLSLESDIAIVATLKKHFSLDDPDSCLRLVNSLKSDEAVLNIVKDLSIYDEDSPVSEFYTYCVAIKLKEDESKLKAISLMHRDYFKFQLARTIQEFEIRLEACKLIEDVDLKKQLLVGDNIQYIDQIESSPSRLRH